MFEYVRESSFYNELVKIAKKKDKDGIKSYVKHIGAGGAFGSAIGATTGSTSATVQNKAIDRVVPKFIPKFLRPQKLRVGRASLAGAALVGITGSGLGATYKAIKDDFKKS